MRRQLCVINPKTYCHYHAGLCKYDYLDSHIFWSLDCWGSVQFCHLQFLIFLKPSNFSWLSLLLLDYKLLMSHIFRYLKDENLYNIISLLDESICLKLLLSINNQTTLHVSEANFITLTEGLMVVCLLIITLIPGSNRCYVIWEFFGQWSWHKDGGIIWSWGSGF